MNAKSNDLLKFLPLFSAALIFLGFFKTNVYYGHFGIEIQNYIEFSEILTLFFDKLIIYSVLVLSVVAWITQAEEDNKKTQISTFPKRKNKINQIILVLTLVAACLLLMLLFSFSTSLQMARDGFLTFIMVLIFGISYGYIWKSFEQSFATKPVVFKYSFLFFFTLGIIWMTASVDATSVLKNDKFQGTKIYLESYTLVSDKNNYYIGNTKNYLFFFHEREKKTDIIPMSLIKKIEYKRTVKMLGLEW